MIYRVTLPNGETLHTGYGPLADVWLNRHGGKLERIPLASIKSVAAEELQVLDNVTGIVLAYHPKSKLNKDDAQVKPKSRSQKI